MSFVEFIGFIISLVAMIILVSKRFMEERKRRLNPGEYARKEREREENLRRYLKSIGMDSEEEKEEIEKEEEVEEEEFAPSHPRLDGRRQAPPPVLPHQALIRLREAQKMQAAPLQKKPVVNPGNYGTETASDKKRNLAATQRSYPSHHELQSAESYEVIRIEQVTGGGASHKKS